MATAGGARGRWTAQATAGLSLAAIMLLALAVPVASESEPAATLEGGDCERCFAGVVPHWVLAVTSSCAGSFLTVSGFVLQKRDLADPTLVNRWPSVGDVVFSPGWIAGFILAVVMPLPATMAAYALAPMSLIAPLGGFTIFVNFVLAPYLLGEKLQLGPDITASVLIITGVVTTTVTGPHGEDAEELSLDRFAELCVHPHFVGLLGIVVVFKVFGLTYMFVNRHGIQKRAEERPLNPPMHELILPAMMYAGFGCFANIALKGVSEVLAGGLNLLIVLLFAAVAVAPPAMLQINFLNRGLRLYVQVIFFPVSSALLLIANTVFGAIFFQEYHAFANAPVRFSLFCFGMVLIVLGINTFRLRRSSPSTVVDIPPPAGKTCEWDAPTSQAADVAMDQKPTQNQDAA